ncbi:GyrI-like domain-containing protein [Demequina sp. SYSU T00192]|uniref:GyrI-like domain-containing protein n=1 Tax=Demequina litoralis TaxID=3051660 RepID=A0ABT8G7F2_9MICO|nr:GyrI-like domain-containing protein [Demequina sp. SYSU T00192]MDN4474849.1 GyrI-like domain-containing protein [Demequina sp. SYSU T00192]
MELEIVEVDPLPVASVARRAPMEEIGPAMADGFGAVMTAIDRRGLTPAGPPLTWYPESMVEGEPLLMVVAVPIDPDVAELEGADVQTLPGRTVATATHVGPYAGLGATYQAIWAAIGEQGLQIAGGPREIYLDDPDVTPEAELRTRIEFPVGS